MKWIAFAAMLLSGAGCVLYYIMPWAIGTFFMREAGSVGIIGGADGPTAIYLASATGLPQFAAPVIFVVSLPAWLWLRRKTKTQR